MGDKVNVTKVEKAGGNADKTKYIGWDKLDIVKSQANEKQILARLEKHLIQHYEKGNINHEAFKQSAGTNQKAEQLSARMARQTGISSHTNERGRKLQTTASSKGNELGQGDRSEVRRSDSPIAITTLTNNSKVLDTTIKYQLEVVLNAVDERISSHPDIEQTKLNELNTKFSEL